MRRFPRWSEAEVVHWRVQGTITNRVSSTADLGEGGVFVATLAPRDAGTRVALRLPNVTGGRELSGIVVRRSDSGMGIALDEKSRLPAR
jgi:hypothetical protein